MVTLASAQMDSLIRPLEKYNHMVGKEEIVKWCWERWKGRSLGFCFSLFREHSIAGVNPVICVWGNLTLAAKKKWQWYLYWKLLWTARTWTSRGLWCCLGLITLDHVNHLILFYCLSLCEIVLIIYLFTMLLSHSPWAIPFTPDCYCSVIKLCPTLCDLMDCSTPGFSVPHHLLELAQVHVHCISNAIQPPHALTPSSPSALYLSQHQGLFQWVGCLHQMTKILELQP